LEGGVKIAQRKICISELAEQASAAVLQIEVVGRRSRELIERRLGGIENPAHRLGAQALQVAETLGDVEHHALRSSLGDLEVVRGLVALRRRYLLLRHRDLPLLYRDLPLRLGDLTLPLRDAGSAGQNNDACGKACRDVLAPPRCGVASGLDVFEV